MKTRKPRFRLNNTGCLIIILAILVLLYASAYLLLWGLYELTAHFLGETITFTIFIILFAAILLKTMRDRKARFKGNK